MPKIYDCIVLQREYFSQREYDIKNFYCFKKMTLFSVLLSHRFLFSVIIRSNIVQDKITS